MLWALNDVNKISRFLSFQTQALALTRPKTPKKDEAGSPPRMSETLRSPIAVDGPHSRPSSKTPVHSSAMSDQQNAIDLNSSNSNANSVSKVSPSPLSEKSSSHHNDNAINGLGSSNNHSQQFSSHSSNGPDKILPSPSIDRKDFDFSKVNGESP